MRRSVSGRIVSGADAMMMKTVARSIYPYYSLIAGPIKTRFKLQQNAQQTRRSLEIGPGPERIQGFETLNIVNGLNVDYVWDAARHLPFPDETYDIVYASHILEHIPWYQTVTVLREWMRILKSGGVLEVWVPNGLKICEAFVLAETADDPRFKEDGWYRFNEEQDPCKWAAGRIFTYGDGSGKLNHPNWHHALFSPRYLKHLFMTIGLTDVREMSADEVRGYDHRWINLGVKGTKR